MMGQYMKAAKGNGNVQAQGQKKEISYEDLKKIAIQYQQKCFALEKELKNTKTVFLRLDLLFRVIGAADKFSEEFVSKCVSEIETLLTIPEKEEEKEEETTEEKTEEAAGDTEEGAEESSESEGE